jgi:hypothetical protein
MNKGASTAVFTFMRHEERLIRRIDRNSARRQGFAIRTTEALKLTVCSIITRKRRYVHKQRLMD